MKTCDHYHELIVHDEPTCPLCDQIDLLEQLEAKLEETQDERDTYKQIVADNLPEELI